MINIELENYLDKLENNFQDYINNKNDEKIYSMDLDYTYPIELYKNSIYNKLE